MEFICIHLQYVESCSRSNEVHKIDKLKLVILWYHWKFFLFTFIEVRIEHILVIFHSSKELCLKYFHTPIVCGLLTQFENTFFILNLKLELSISSVIPWYNRKYKTITLLLYSHGAYICGQIYLNVNERKKNLEDNK